MRAECHVRWRRQTLGQRSGSRGSGSQAGEWPRSPLRGKSAWNPRSPLALGAGCGARGVMGGVACLIHATKPRLGQTDCGSSVGPHSDGPVWQGVARLDTASSRDISGQGHYRATLAPRHIASRTKGGRPSRRFEQLLMKASGLEWWTVRGARPNQVLARADDSSAQ